MSNILYREATLSDLDELVSLRWEFRTESDEVNPKLQKAEFILECRNFLVEGLRNKSWTYWIAEENGKIISHAFVQTIPMIPNPNRIQDKWGYVTNCYTRPEFRSKGIGSSLMEVLIQWARTIDLELLIVWPSDESLSYYKRLGFSEKNDILQLSLRDV